MSPLEINKPAPRNAIAENVARNVTMTSLELVNFINGHRKQQAEAVGADFPSEGFAVLQHKDFLAKVPKVLGATSAKFSADLLDSYGRPRTAYCFPKREACLMAMSYSYELQAAVFDHMTALEERLSQQVPAFAIPTTLPEALRLAADLAEQNAQLTVANLEQATKIDALQSLFHEGQSPTEFCKKLNGVNVMQVCSVLEGRGWLFNESKSGVRWRVASYARDRYLTEHQQRIAPHGQEAFIRHTPVLLRKGAEKLFDLYLKCELPMKKSWDGLYTHDKSAKGVA